MARQVGSLHAYDDQADSLEALFANVVSPVLIRITVPATIEPSGTVVLDGQPCLLIEQIGYTDQVACAVEDRFIDQEGRQSRLHLTERSGPCLPRTAYPDPSEFRDPSRLNRSAPAV